jgi:CHAT domain-containing protein
MATEVTTTRRHFSSISGLEICSGFPVSLQTRLLDEGEMLWKRILHIPTAVLAIGIAIYGQPPFAWAQGAEEIAALNKQVGDLSAQEKYKEATPIAEQALALAERTLGEGHSATISSLDNLANLFRAQERNDEAERVYKRALAAKERTLGKDDGDTLTSVSSLASLYRAQGRYKEAEPLYERAVEARERTLGREHERTLISLNNMADLYHAQGRYDQAETLHRRVLETAERTLGKDHPLTLSSLGNLASVYRAQGRFNDAGPLLLRALEAKERTLGSEHASTLISVNNLAELRKMQGRHSEAEPLYKRALEAKERTLGSEHPSTLISVSNLGDLYANQGRYGEAEPLYRRALEAKDRTLGAEHPSTIISVNNLAALYRAQGRNNEAEPLYRRALTAKERKLGATHPSTLISVNNMAALQRALGRTADAEKLYKRAGEAYERTLGADHPSTLTAISNLAALYLDEPGRDGVAEPLLKRALDARLRTLGEDHPDTLISLNNMAAYYFDQSDWMRAASFWRRSTNAIVQFALRGDENDEEVLVGKQKSQMEKKSWQFRNLVRAVHQLAPAGAATAASIRETFQTAQWVLESEAARSLAEMAARGAKGDAALARAIRERQDLVTEWRKRDALRNAALGEASSKRDAKAYAQNLAQLAILNERIATIDKVLAVKFPDYASLVRSAPLSVEEAQAQLHPDEALVMFLDTPEWRPAPNRTFAWVVTKSEVRWADANLSTEELSREVTALRCGLDAAAWTGPGCAELIGQNYTDADADAGRPLPFDTARAYRLYKTLFGQVEELIKGKQLLLVPSGPLTQLPFQVLITASPANDNYQTVAWLARDHALTVLPAVSSLKALRSVTRPSAATKPLIGFGNPLLDGPDSRYARLAERARGAQACRETRLERVASFLSRRGGASPMQMRGSGVANLSVIREQSPLPETADELCAVARNVGADLSELRLGARATEREVKTLSADGRLAQYRIVHFATHGAMAGELTKASEPGLLMTPPSEASEEDDGYLSSSEIAGLKLDADWVILSACNTAAAAAPNAEALSGLARAFIYAQARALLVSHWAVNSDATVKLITSAMREIGREKTGRAEALRRAMLALIDKGGPQEAHPAYWAPFIVVGEGAR